ncbi:MAG: hypothetical protein QOE45_1102 [Frankiaceae bacterium]|jgi:hypothetical protein|nr:hypothetical protein [Frankiaceae bacterium]
MLRIVQRVAAVAGYLRGMAAGTRWEPERRPAELDQFVGMWVAVKDGRVVTCARNARDLVPRLHELGDQGKGAVAQYVPYPSDAVMIGVG